MYTIGARRRERERTNRVEATFFLVGVAIGIAVKSIILFAQLYFGM